MNKAELVRAISAQADISATDAGTVLNVVLQSIAEALKSGDEGRLPGFGVFYVASRAASEGRTPRTGEKIKIAANRQPRFRPFSGLRSAVSGKPRSRPAEPAVPRNLTDLFEPLRSQRTSDLQSSRAYRLLSSLLHDSNLATQAMSRLFWRAYFANLSVGFTSPLPIEHSIIVGTLDQRSFNALILSPSVNRLTRITSELLPIIRTQYSRMANDLIFSGDRLTGLEKNINDVGVEIGPQLFSDVIEKLSPEILAGPVVQMDDLCVPIPPWELESIALGHLSTSGALANNKEGVLGITGALHATGKTGSQVIISGRNSGILDHDEITDSVFIPLPEGINIRPLGAPQGPLIFRPPYAREPATFSGISNEDGKTIITGHDPPLPVHYPGMQLRVYTDPVIDFGDSGSALVNSEGHLVGFAYQRTPFGAPYHFATWVWAHSVFESLEITAAS